MTATNFLQRFKVMLLHYRMLHQYELLIADAALPTLALTADRKSSSGFSTGTLSWPCGALRVTGAMGAYCHG